MKKKYLATSKDKKDWIAFTKYMGNISAKESDLLKENIEINKVQKLDLHGFSLIEANKITKNFIIKSSKILEFKKIENVYKVTVNFVSEIITCVKDKNNKVIEGNPDVIKTVHDVWKFSKNMWSQDPTWYLVETSNNK